MRGYIPDYDITVPDSLAQALEMLADKPEKLRPLAGGTDLMVVLNTGNQHHRHFLSLHHLDELKGIEVRPDEVEIRALTTYSEVRYHGLLREEFPMLCQAAAESGAGAIQNRGTIGGNIGNASPAADTPPALLVYEAVVDLVSVEGNRTVPLAEFFLDYKVLDLKPGELIRAVRVPRIPGRRHLYRKVGTRKAQAISKVCFAGCLVIPEAQYIEKALIAMGSVGPTVALCWKLGERLSGRTLASAGATTSNEIRALVAEEISPIDDIRSSGEFRLKVAQNLAVDFVRNLENL